MTAQKYVVWKKDVIGGAETTVWDGFALSPNEAIAFARVERPEIKDTPSELLRAEVVQDEPTNDSVESTSGTEESDLKVPGGKKPRKPRSDRGQPHDKKTVTPAKRVRNRGQFFIFKGAPDQIIICPDSDALTAYLETDAEITLLVRGQRYDYFRKIQHIIKKSK